MPHHALLRSWIDSTNSNTALHLFVRETGMATFSSSLKGTYPEKPPPGYVLPAITTPDTPWYLRGNISTAPPPPGVLPNFVDPESQQFLNVVTQSICLPVATILVVLRIYVKARVLRKLGWEDLTCVVGWLGLLASSTIMCFQSRYGNGRHIWNIKGDDYVNYLRFVYAEEVIYGPVIFAVKLAILLLYLRVFQPIRATWVALHMIVWGNLLSYVIIMFMEAFQCWPVGKAWYPLFPGRCVDQTSLQISSASINIISDFAILVLPITTVWNLNVSQKKKYGLFAVFGFGLA